MFIMKRPARQLRLRVHLSCLLGRGYHSVLLGIVLQQVLGDELDGFLGLLLRELFEGLEQQRHELLVEVGLDGQLLNFNLLYDKRLISMVCAVATNIIQLHSHGLL